MERTHYSFTLASQLICKNETFPNYSQRAYLTNMHLYVEEALKSDEGEFSALDFETKLRFKDKRPSCINMVIGV